MGSPVSCDWRSCLRRPPNQSQSAQASQTEPVTEAGQQLKPHYHGIYLTAPAGAVSGADLYRQLCADCYRADGCGVGATSRYCVVSPTDLTLRKEPRSDSALRHRKTYAIAKYDMYAGVEATPEHDSRRITGTDRAAHKLKAMQPKSAPEERAEISVSRKPSQPSI